MTSEKINEMAENCVRQYIYETRSMSEIIAEALRAVEAETLEKAANIYGDGRHCCEDCPCSGKADEVRALKPQLAEGGASGASPAGE